MNNVCDLVWPEGGNTRIPYQIYSDPAIFRMEMDRIFSGAGWAYVGLEIEIQVGDFEGRVGDGRW
jgi:phenylpropionate dioxygenase-like ring-hydroxylating dioxygenase large terminal subunit